jgi:cation transport regulator ChaC
MKPRGGVVQSRRVWTFFYGSFINLDALAEVDVRPTDVEVARLSGFDIHIGPLANLSASEGHSVYGIVARVTHAELKRLYAQDWVGLYLPEAVLVEMKDGKRVPALCYISPPRKPSAPSSDYVNRIVTPAEEYGFPHWYLDHLRSFLD